MGVKNTDPKESLAEQSAMSNAENRSNCMCVAISTPETNQDDNICATDSYNIPFILHILFFSLLIILLFVVNQLPQNMSRGFFCNDESLAYPYLADTVTVPVLYFVPLGVLFFTVFAMEGILYKYNKTLDLNNSDNIFHDPENTIKIFNMKVSKCVSHIYKYLVCGIFACGTSTLTVELLKCIFSRPRPHFFDKCKPDWDSITCMVDDRYIYVTEYTCLNDIPDSIRRNLYRSFPSGHASYSWTFAVYLLLYLQHRGIQNRINQDSTIKRRLTNEHPILYTLWEIIKILIIGLQSLLIIGPIYVCGTRYFDNRHHMSDLLIGSLIGILFSGYWAIFICKMRITKRE